MNSWCWIICQKISYKNYGFYYYWNLESKWYCILCYAIISISFLYKSCCFAIKMCIYMYHVWSISFFLRNIGSSHLKQKLLLTRECVLNLNQGHLDRFKVTGWKSIIRMNTTTWHKNVCDLKRCPDREFCLFVHVQCHWKNGASVTFNGGTIWLYFLCEGTCIICECPNSASNNPAISLKIHSR